MGTTYLKKLTHNYREYLNQIIEPCKHQFSSVQSEVCYLQKTQNLLIDEVVCLLKYMDRHGVLSDYMSDWPKFRKLP